MTQPCTFAYVTLSAGLSTLSACSLKTQALSGSS